MAVAATHARNAGLNYAGRRAIVVGGTAGIGEGIALRLAKANFAVTVVGRNEERGRAVVAALSALSSSGATHEFVPCDGSLIGNAMAFGAAYTARYSSLDVLVLTQGIATMQGRTETAEGVDQKLALHYYARMAFINSLLPALRCAAASSGSTDASEPRARVLTVLSAGVHSPYAGWETDPELRASYGLKNAADAAGTYSDLAVDALAADPANAGIAFIHAAPGVVNSRWGTEMPWLVRGLLAVIKPLAGRSIADCGEMMADALLRPSLEGLARIPAPAPAPTPAPAPIEASVAASASAGAAGAATAAPRAHACGRYLLLDHNGAPASAMPLHTPAVRDAVWAHTLKVLARVPEPTAAAQLK